MSGLGRGSAELTGVKEGRRGQSVRSSADSSDRSIVEARKLEHHSPS